MTSLGFVLEGVRTSEGNRIAKWTFNSGGQLAVHHLDVELNVNWLTSPIDAINHIYHEAWGKGRDEKTTEVRRVLGFHEL